MQADLNGDGRNEVLIATHGTVIHVGVRPSQTAFEIAQSLFIQLQCKCKPILMCSTAILYHAIPIVCLLKSVCNVQGWKG